MQPEALNLYKLLGVMKEHVRWEQNQSLKGEYAGWATIYAHGTFTPGFCPH